MKAKAIISAICAVLFGISLFREVFVFQSGDSSFLMGLICLLFGWSKVQWLANPLVVASHILVFRGRLRLSFLSSATAVVLALSTLSLREVPKDESGAMTPILGFSSGYYLWLSVMVISLGESIGFCLISKRPNQPPQRNAGSRPPMDDSPASETRSSLGPRGSYEDDIVKREADGHR